MGFPPSKEGAVQETVRLTSEVEAVFTTLMGGPGTLKLQHGGSQNSGVNAKICCTRAENRHVLGGNLKGI